MGSLVTPDSIRRLQRKLYLKAKQEPNFRFYTLYDKIYRGDILLHAYNLVRANGGAPGVDGITFAMIEADGAEAWLFSLQQDLREKRYEPQPVRRVMIPKAGGGERPLGIPTIRDRVVQMAAKLVLEPIFEADFEPVAYGYRPRRSAHQALGEITQTLRCGYADVVDADLSKYFDTIPHAELMKSLARRIADKQVLKLTQSWLKVPVEERRENGTRSMTGGKDKGTPQGGVISPLLANLYMNRFLKYWRLTCIGTVFRAKIISYADDFVILSRGCAKEAMAWTKAVMTRLGLTLNEEKTKIKDARKERFDFLGYSFGIHNSPRNGRAYMGASPSKKSIARIKDKIGDILDKRNGQDWQEISRKLNQMLDGWSNYFSYGTVSKAYADVNNHVYECARGLLRRRHKVPSRGTNDFSQEVVYGEMNVRYVQKAGSKKRIWKPACALG
jgi:RNA-directed DNA polymerase